MFSLSFLQTFFRDFILMLLILFPGAIYTWAILFFSFWITDSNEISCKCNEVHYIALILKVTMI